MLVLWDKSDPDVDQSEVCCRDLSVVSDLLMTGAESLTGGQRRGKQSLLKQHVPFPRAHVQLDQRADSM